MDGETKLCRHLEVGEFGTYTIRTKNGQLTATLQRCSSCKKFLTLDSQEIPEDAIIGPVKAERENMRTSAIQMNGDLYDKIQDLIAQEDCESDPSKIFNELLALGLHHYRLARSRPS